MKADQKVSKKSAAPIRIQRKRTKGWKLPPNTICVTRGTKFGNPFIGLKAVEAFANYLGGEKSFAIGESLSMAFIPTWHYAADIRERLPELRGKNLACFCSLDKPCHADVLLRLANRE